ncbi:hypothetical protein VTJ04DRAFT_1728 [Mycothermus thermophilus]|uniref:uncharacterized protein n=1 Tax=Humicola insolens TaxID=85995 RepID=UPI003743A49B
MSQTGTKATLHLGGRALVPLVGMPTINRQPPSDEMQLPGRRSSRRVPIMTTSHIDLLPHNKPFSLVVIPQDALHEGGLEDGSTAKLSSSFEFGLIPALAGSQTTPCRENLSAVPAAP